MAFELGITNLIWPSALVGPGGWRQRRIVPSGPLNGTKPFLPTTSCSMLLGTSHHGLRITPTAVAESCGVGVESLPAIARFFHRLTPFSTSVARQPAPALEVEADPVHLRGFGRWRRRQRQLERGILRVSREPAAQRRHDLV